MLSTKTQQKLIKRRICLAARSTACASFLVLVIIGVSSLVRAMTLEPIANENGIPSSWKTSSLGNPDTITLPITYWDQRQDDCEASDRQFEWVECGIYGKGVISDIVKSHLGTDGLPIPSFADTQSAWESYHDIFTSNVIGHDPVQSTDNFYRWFHETTDSAGKQLSKQYDREIVFTRNGNNSYEYGSRGTFPLDNVDFSKSDSTTRKGHNYHFTAHMRVPMKIDADGTEQFWFSGDDDVWVFLNGQLVLDIGGLHEDIEGNFVIGKDGNVISTVNNVNDQTCRRKIKSPKEIGNSRYNDQVSNCPRAPETKTIYTNFKSGDIVNLDFFYAERSTSESNTRINISNMNWPISAASSVEAKIVGKIEDSESKLVEFNSSISNQDPDNPLKLNRLAAYVREDIEDETTSGYLPLDKTTLFYTTTPKDDASWKPVDISTPDNTIHGFNLASPLVMSPAGTAGDTLYFRYLAETSEYAGTMYSLVSFYTTLEGEAGVTYDSDSISYDGLSKYEPEPEEPTNPEPETPEPEEPEQPEPEDPEAPSQQENPDDEEEPETPAASTTPEDKPVIPSAPSQTPSNLPVIPTFPGSNLINGSLLYLAPLGEIAYVPNTGVVSDAVASLFTEDFAEAILSQAFVMVMLLIFAGSFAVYFSLRHFLITTPAMATRKSTARKMPKSKASAKNNTTTRKTTTRGKTNTTKTATTTSRTAKGTRTSRKTAKR